MIRVEDVLELMPEKQEVTVVYEGFCAKAEAEALRCLLSDDVLRGVVTMIRQPNKSFERSIEITAKVEDDQDE